MKAEVAAYASEHGASFNGAMIALAARGLREVEREKLAIRPAPRTQAYDVPLLGESA